MGVGALGRVLVVVVLFFGVLALGVALLGVLVVAVGLLAVLVLGVGLLAVIVVLEVLGVLAVVEELDGGADFEGLVGGVLADGLVEFGHEALEVDDVVGLFDGGDVAGGEFEVVRLLAGRGEVGHVDVVAADLFGREGERVEGGHDVDLAVGGGGVAVAAGGEGGRREEPGGGHCEHCSAHTGNLAQR